MLHELLAIVFLSLVALAPVAGYIRAWRRTDYSLVQYPLFVLAYLLVRLQWRAQLPAGFPVARGRGAVIVCNHRSSVDPFFVQMLFSHATHWMVAKEYCVHPAFGWFLRLCEVIPTNRAGVDTAATKMAIRLAARGEIVGMFPEGRINMTDQPLMAARPGAILVALRAQVPIVPCYIHGAPFDEAVWSPFFHLAKVRVVMGKPIDLSAYYDRQNENGIVGELALEVLRKLAQLGGNPDFEPSLAGRRWKPDVTVPSEERLVAEAS